jgi:hypothetical protein
LKRAQSHLEQSALSRQVQLAHLVLLLPQALLLVALQALHKPNPGVAAVSGRRHEPETDIQE